MCGRIGRGAGEGGRSSKPVCSLALSIPLYFTDPAPLKPTPRDNTCHVHTTTYTNTKMLIIIMMEEGLSRRQTTKYFGYETSVEICF